MSANGYKVFCEKRLETGNRMKRAPMGFFSEQNLGMINTALSSATTELESFSMVAVDNIVGGIIQAVFVMLVLLYFNWQVALLALVGMLLSSSVLKLVKSRTTKQAPRREAAREKMVSKVIEYIQGISVIRAFGRQPDDEIDQVFGRNKRFLYYNGKTGHGHCPFIQGDFGSVYRHDIGVYCLADDFLGNLTSLLVLCF